MNPPLLNKNYSYLDDKITYKVIDIDERLLKEVVYADGSYTNSRISYRVKLEYTCEKFGLVSMWTPWSQGYKLIEKFDS
jgi:hypothetical protein